MRETRGLTTCSMRLSAVNASKSMTSKRERAISAPLVKRKRERMTLATCKVCVDDFNAEDMIEDIEGAKYCLVDSGDICPICGIYEHDCEGKK